MKSTVPKGSKAPGTLPEGLGKAVISYDWQRALIPISLPLRNRGAALNLKYDISVFKAF